MHPPPSAGATDGDTDRQHRRSAAETPPTEETTAAAPERPESPADAAAAAEARAESITEPAATAEEAAQAEETAPSPEQDGSAPPREAELEAEVADLKERLLRALADAENTRRRAARDIEDARKYAITGFARDLLEVADNLGRALQSIPEQARGDIGFIKNLAEGIGMTERSLLGAFERHRIAKVEPRPGDKFDHNLHQAMFEVETADQPPGTVAQVLQAGYVIEDRPQRPAMVGVAKARPQADAEAAGAAEGDDEAPAPEQDRGGDEARRPGARIDRTA